MASRSLILALLTLLIAPSIAHEPLHHVHGASKGFCHDGSLPTITLEDEPSARANPGNNCAKRKTKEACWKGIAFTETVINSFEYSCAWRERRRQGDIVDSFLFIAQNTTYGDQVLIKLNSTICGAQTAIFLPRSAQGYWTAGIVNAGMGFVGPVPRELCLAGTASSSCSTERISPVSPKGEPYYERLEQGLNLILKKKLPRHTKDMRALVVRTYKECVLRGRPPSNDIVYHYNKNFPLGMDTGWIMAEYTMNGFSRQTFHKATAAQWAVDVQWLAPKLGRPQRTTPILCLVLARVDFDKWLDECEAVAGKCRPPMQLALSKGVCLGARCKGSVSNLTPDTFYTFMLSLPFVSFAEEPAFNPYLPSVTYKLIATLDPAVFAEEP